jgi:asparagine synthase (glutamine-hydrolysing)
MMCGIAGIFNLRANRGIDQQLLERMTDLIRHRGPYDGGFLYADAKTGAVYERKEGEACDGASRKLTKGLLGSQVHLGLGFRRLPILDLCESGHQPMYDNELGLAIVFNGEIYNFIELRNELVGLGYVFVSTSDTEVLLKAYHAWGDEFVHRLNGMWAFAIWDSANTRLYCSRDRFGVKPFYYGLKDGNLYWGSEMKQLLECPIDKSLNQAMIWRSMKINALLVYDDQTYWKHIHSFMPGHNLICEKGVI